MENIAHTMLGFVLAKAGLEKKSRFATTALVLGSNLPDVDAVSLVKGTLAYIDCHRGATHSIAGAAVLAAAFGAGLWAFDRAVVAPLGKRRERARERRAAAPGAGDGAPDDPAAPGGGPERARLLPLVAVSLLALLCHLGFDLLNDYGIRLLIPFSERWIYGDLIFIVDPWFWLILGGSLYLVMKPGLLRGAAAWAGWAVLSLPVLFEDSVPVPARVVWLLGLATLLVLRWRGVGQSAGEVPPVELPPSLRPGSIVGEQRASRGTRANEPAASGGGPALPPDRASSVPQMDGSDPLPAEGGLTPPGAEGAPGSGGFLVPRLALVLLVAYIGAVLVLHQLALRRAREAIGATAPAPQIRRLAVLPQPADPLHWRVVWEDDGELRSVVLSALGAGGPVATGPRFALNLDNPAARAALETPVGQVARRFCRYLFAELEESAQGTIVAFQDVRFASRGRNGFGVFTVVVPRAAGEPRP